MAITNWQSRQWRDSCNRQSPIATDSIVKKEKVDDDVNDESTFHSRMMKALSHEHKQDAHDVTFIVGSEKTEIGAHKMILQMQSPKFRDLFQNNKDVYDIIAEDNVTPEEFRLLLQFLYTGVLADNIESVLPILQLAVKYYIPDLENLCCNRLLKIGLELKSVVQIHEQATKLGQEEVAGICLNFMWKNGSDVLNSTEFLQFTNENLCALISSDCLQVNNETEVFQAVLRWGKNQCEAKGKQLSGENLRDELKKLIPLIRFPLMDISYFNSEVIPTEMLTDEEIISVLYYGIDRKREYRSNIAPWIFSHLRRRRLLFPTVTNTTIIPLLEELGTYRDRMLHELFYGNQNAYDATFIVGSKKIEIGAHRIILQIQCPKLYEILDPSRNAYNVEDDCTPAEFRMFLQFLYTGVLTDDDRIYALPLLNLAIKYDIPDLRKVCNRLLEKKFDSQCDVQMYEEAIQCGQTELKHKYLDLICRNGSKILDSTEFLEFTNQTLCTVIASDDLITLKEIEVFKAVVRWGKKKCMENGNDTTGANLRNELKDLIPLIRFPLMNKIEFFQEVVPSHILNGKEIISVLVYYNARECQKNLIAPGIFSTTPRKKAECNNVGSKIKKALGEGISIFATGICVFLIVYIIVMIALLLLLFIRRISS